MLSVGRSLLVHCLCLPFYAIFMNNNKCSEHNCKDQTL